VEENFLSLKSSTLLLEREVVAIKQQKEDIENNHGLSVWPRPILLLAASKVGDENFLYLIIKPCAFCNRGFHCWDIAATSCKHTFHPFCLSEIVRTSNRCFVCNALFHPDWWHSWGFQGEDKEILSQEMTPPLQEVHDSIIHSLKEAFSFTIFSETGQCFFLSFSLTTCLEVGVRSSEGFIKLCILAFLHRIDRMLFGICKMSD
jgi:hypothetical protein